MKRWIPWLLIVAGILCVCFIAARQKRVDIASRTDPATTGSTSDGSICTTPSPSASDILLETNLPATSQDQEPSKSGTKQTPSVTERKAEKPVETGFSAPPLLHSTTVSTPKASAVSTHSPTPVPQETMVSRSTPVVSPTERTAQTHTENATDSPTPQATNNPTSTSASTPIPQATEFSAATPLASATATPAQTYTPTITESSTPQTEKTPTPSSTATAAPENTAVSTATPSASSTEKPTEEPTTKPATSDENEGETFNIP